MVLWVSDDEIWWWFTNQNSRECRNRHLICVFIKMNRLMDRILQQLSLIFHCKTFTVSVSLKLVCEDTTTSKQFLYFHYINITQTISTNRRLQIILKLWKKNWYFFPQNIFFLPKHNSSTRTALKVVTAPIPKARASVMLVTVIEIAAVSNVLPILSSTDHV